MKTQTVKLNYENFFSFSRLFKDKELAWLKLKNTEQNSYFPDPIFSKINDNDQTIETLKKLIMKNIYKSDKKKIISYYFYNLENIRTFFFFTK